LPIRRRTLADFTQETTVSKASIVYGIPRMTINILLKVALNTINLTSFTA
jgi:hypothetical protein